MEEKGSNMEEHGGAVLTDGAGGGLLIFFTWWQRHASVGLSQLSPACLALPGDREEQGEEQGVAGRGSEE
jgi:hypothetical protein